MANVAIQYGYEHKKLVMRVASYAVRVPRFGAVLQTEGSQCALSAHSRGDMTVVYFGPTSELPKDWKVQAMAAVDALDEAWAVEP